MPFLMICRLPGQAAGSPALPGFESAAPAALAIPQMPVDLAQIESCITMTGRIENSMPCMIATKNEMQLRS